MVAKKEPAADAKKKDAVKKETPAKKAKADTKPEEKKPAAKKVPYGKWVVSKSDGGTYYFELRASNGEKMLTSGEYATLAGAKSGIDTYKKNIEKGCESAVESTKRFAQTSSVEISPDAE